MTRICETCGTPAADDMSVFCNRCGERLPTPDILTCSTCGKTFSDPNSHFCNRCGTPLGAPSPHLSSSPVSREKTRPGINLQPSNFSDTTGDNKPENSDSITTKHSNKSEGQNLPERIKHEISPKPPSGLSRKSVAAGVGIMLIMVITGILAMNFPAILQTGLQNATAPNATNPAELKATVTVTQGSSVSVTELPVSAGQTPGIISDTDTQTPGISPPPVTPTPVSNQNSTTQTPVITLSTSSLTPAITQTPGIVPTGTPETPATPSPGEVQQTPAAQPSGGSVTPAPKPPGASVTPAPKP